MIDAKDHPDGVRVTRGPEQQLVLHVHVGGNDVPPDEAQARPRRRTGANGAGTRTNLRLSGRLFGWQDHYHPIAKRMQALAVEQTPQKAALWHRLSRIGLFIALLATLLAVGCRYL